MIATRSLALTALVACVAWTLLPAADEDIPPYALTGRREEAFDALRRAIALGYDNLDQIQKDSDLDGLRADVRFRGMVACLKLKHETAGRA